MGERPDPPVLAVSRTSPNFSVGYDLSNIRLVCRIVNTMKLTMSDLELVEWCKKIIHTMEAREKR